jgi:hypothetical protein
MSSIRGQVDSRAVHNLIHLPSIIWIDLVVWPDGAEPSFVAFRPKLGQSSSSALFSLTISALMVSKYSAVPSESPFNI